MENARQWAFALKNYEDALRLKRHLSSAERSDIGIKKQQQKHTSRLRILIFKRLVYSKQSDVESTRVSESLIIR